MPIGNINQDIKISIAKPFIVGGKASDASNPLSTSMNLEPAAVALLLCRLIVQSKMDTRALDASFGLGGLKVAVQENDAPDSSLFANFNVSQYTLDAMKALKVDLSLTSTLVIGQYVNDLSFSQGNVAVAIDSSVAALSWSTNYATSC